jgi:sulfatase maturation enzyme AslB (radical SAM superfamily)
MAKPVGPECNLRCDYCFYYEKKNIFKQQKIMSPEILERYVRDYISSNQQTRLFLAGREVNLLSRVCHSLNK